MAAGGLREARLSTGAANGWTAVHGGKNRKAGPRLSCPTAPCPGHLGETTLLSIPLLRPAEGSCRTTANAAGAKSGLDAPWSVPREQGVVEEPSASMRSGHRRGGPEASPWTRGERSRNHHVCGPSRSGNCTWHLPCPGHLRSGSEK